jgi:hypothetical protein
VIINPAVLKLGLAGLGIDIRSELAIAPSQVGRFQPFTSMTKSSIRIATNLVGAKDLKDEALDPETGFLLAHAARRGISSRLLNFSKVRSRLEMAAGHSPYLYVEMHDESMSITDFHENRADYYFLARPRKALAQRCIGPAMLAPFLPRFDALMLHASAIVRDGRAAVFLAPDEGGKTTAVRLAPAGTVLGDDQVIVRRRRGRFRVWGTPWGLHVHARASAPLRGLFILQKARRFSLEPVPATELVPRIWEEIKSPLSILPKPLKKKAFGLLCDIAAAAPAWRLSFPKEQIDWDTIDEALKKGNLRSSCKAQG